MGLRHGEATSFNRAYRGMTGTASPRVSWLLPVFNGEAFLREALDSILAQDFADFEVVVVNDGSTDGTRSILAEYEARDPRIQVIDKANGGIVSALNAGLTRCVGEYIARMDADDIAMPHRLSLQVAYLDAHPRCVLVGGRAVTLGGNGAPMGRTTGGSHCRTDLAVFPPRVAVAMHPLVTLRREVLLAIGGYRSLYPHAEDYDLFLRLSAHGTIDNPGHDMLVYRRHEGAISIRNMETQERSAALAETEAIARAGLAPVPGPLLERYIRLRIFRRYLRLDRAAATRLLPRLAFDLVGPPSTWLDRKHWRLRAITIANLLKYLKCTISLAGVGFRSVRSTS